MLKKLISGINFGITEKGKTPAPKIQKRKIREKNYSQLFHYTCYSY